MNNVKKPDKSLDYSELKTALAEMKVEQNTAKISEAKEAFFHRKARKNLHLHQKKKLEAYTRRLRGKLKNCGIGYLRITAELTSHFCAILSFNKLTQHLHLIRRRLDS